MAVSVAMEERAIDEDRRERVMELLRGLNDRFEQIVVITHLPMQEEFQQVIEVRYDEANGSSIVKQIQPGPFDEREMLAAAGVEG